jgi:hypothetical protein
MVGCPPVHVCVFRDFFVFDLLNFVLFGSWLCFRPQVNGGEEEKNTYSVWPLRQLSRCSSLLPLHSPEEGSRASFRNVVILVFNF